VLFMDEPTTGLDPQARLFVSAGTAPAPPLLGGRQRADVLHAFLSILGRDLFVTGRELPAFLLQVILQPFFLVFVFGKVLTGCSQYPWPSLTRLPWSRT
jgi:hypothetical protein